MCVVGVDGLAPEIEKKRKKKKTNLLCLSSNRQDGVQCLVVVHLNQLAGGIGKIGRGVNNGVVVNAVVDDKHPCGVSPVFPVAIDMQGLDINRHNLNGKVGREDGQLNGAWVNVNGRTISGNRET